MDDKLQRWLETSSNTLNELLSAEERAHAGRWLEAHYGVTAIARLVDAEGLDDETRKLAMGALIGAAHVRKIMALEIPGAAPVKPEPLVVVPEAPKAEPKPAVVPVPAPYRNGKAAPVEEPVPDESDVARQIADAVRVLARGVTPKAGMDEGRFTALFDERWAAKSETLEELIRKIGSGGQRITVDGPWSNGTPVDMGEEPRHWQFPQLLTWIGANVPVWLWGKAGGGKTHLARQLAKALGLEATVLSIDPTITVGKLVGFRNLATGEFVEGLLYRAYRDGGLLMLDEIDTGDPGILAALNALLANGHYLFPNGETVERHPKFRVLAGANTKGTGAVAGYTARQRLDAATLNRFAVIELVYDERLEELLCVGETAAKPKAWEPTTPASRHEFHGLALRRRWFEWVRKVRALVGESVLISPRASYLGVSALMAGVPMGEVADALVFPLMSADTKAGVVQRCGGAQ